MNPPTPMMTGGSRERPVFFLSYVHTPQPFDDPDHDPDQLVFEFFAELQDQVEQLSGTPPGAAAGFAERLGDPPPRVLDALGGSRVFVPLCSPRYFASWYCGQQWQAFRQRPGGVGAIVPALWAPVPLGQQPLVAREFGREDFTEDGLYALATGEEDELYQKAVLRLAERIVEVARRSPAVPVPGTEIGPLDLLPDAFAAVRPRPRLGVAVLAPSASGLPAGRDPKAYGPSPLDWRPYGTPLAERMAELARNLGFAPEIRVFDASLGELLGTAAATGPWVVLLDPWALHDPATVDLVRAFDRVEQPWTVVLTALSSQDDQSLRQGDGLRALVRETLPRISRRGRALQQTAVTGIANSETYGRLFSELVETTGLQFLMRGQVTSRKRPPVPGGGRPRLGIDGSAVHDVDDHDGEIGPEATR